LTDNDFDAWPESIITLVLYQNYFHIIVGMAPPMDFSKFMPAGGRGFGMPGGDEGFDDVDMGGGLYDCLDFE
jgi:hypothetical protein